MAYVFGDESADEKAKIVFAVAALVGADSVWDSAVSEWISVTEGREFHAAEWEHEWGRDSYVQLARVIQSSGLRGQGVAIDLCAFRGAFPDLKTQDYAYHKCFIEVVDRLVKISAEQGYKDLNFTFDGRQGQGTTGLLYECLRTQREWADALSFAENISFANRKNPRIQMADLVARETMNGFLSTVNNGPYRQAFKCLGSSEQRIWFNFLLEDYFSQWRDHLPELERATGLYSHEYFAWIKRKNMQDNLNSRIMYMKWHDAKASRAKRGRQPTV